METILQLVVIVILTVFEGVFVAAEIALVTIRRTRIEQLAEEGNRSAKRVRGLIAQPGRFLAVTQIGLTFLGLPRLGVCGRQPDGQPGGSVFEGSGWPILSAPRPAALALIIVTLLLSLFTIVFGELVPKSLALAHTETIRPPPERLHRGPPARALGPLVRRPDGDHDGRRRGCSARATMRRA